MIKLIISLNVLILSFLTFFSPKNVEKIATTADMPMCSPTQIKDINSSFLTFSYNSVSATTIPLNLDVTNAFSMPLLSQTPQGDILLSWIEKNDAGTVYFNFSVSKDKGKTFSDAKTIFSGTGISSSRLFRAKLMAKKDGSLVAVFANRAATPPSPPQGGQPQAQEGRPQVGRGGRGGGGGRASALVFIESKDGGNTWTTPQSVDTDPTQGLMRGFFDAVILPNDEIAVAYLKDVKGSTKHEERDLRLAITKNGVFQEEKLLDAVVCDCCNINLLVDGKGALNVIYRDNDNDIRDFSAMVSNDNGITFSKPKNIYDDGWKIAGCPHNGAISGASGKNALFAWYSGAETESGVRLVTQEGKKLAVLNDPSVKNFALATSTEASALLWEQGNGKTQLFFKKIKGDKVAETVAVEGSEEATNATAMVVGDQLLIVHEVKKADKKNSLKVMTLNL